MERILRVPTIEKSIDLLNWAGELNPGLWTKHSLNVARAAQIIASNCGLHSQSAYCMGLLHDIGRYKGIVDLKHVVYGYKLMTEQGYDDIARISLTHSFPIPKLQCFSGKNDCNNEEITFLKAYLENIEFDDYDKLIQLCDALGDANGITLIETRLVDVARRRGINNMTLDKWNTFFDLKEYFSNKCGQSIYKFFDKEICNSIIK